MVPSLSGQRPRRFGKALLPDPQTHENLAVHLRGSFDDFSFQHDSTNNPEMKTKPTLHPARRPTLFFFLFGTPNRPRNP